MKLLTLLFALTGVMSAQNAALRYWSAFAQMQDSTVAPDQAKELNAILEGTAPYDDLKQRDLVERNRAAIETMQRGAELTNCDWGLEYELKSHAPMEYVRKALALGRLNVLFAFHQLQTGDQAGALRSLTQGLRFAQHVSAGGPLFSSLVSKSLLVSHLRALDFVAKVKPLSTQQKQVFLTNLPADGGVDWQAAMTRELQVVDAPARTAELYRRALAGGSMELLKKSLDVLPVRERIPKPERVLSEKRELDERLAKSRAMLAVK